MRTRVHPSPVRIIASLLIALIAGLTWLVRLPLSEFAKAHPAFYPAIVIGASLLCVTFAIVLTLDAAVLRRTWLERSAAVTGLKQLEPPSIYKQLGRFISAQVDRLSGPFMRSAIGTRLGEEWSAAELGGNPSRYVFVQAAFASIGCFIGLRVGGPLLALGLSVILPILPRALVRSRAERQGRRFAEQLPHVLDGLSSGLSAGLSLHGAVDYMLADLSQPARAVFASLSRRMDLGVPIEEALTRLQHEVNEEALTLAVDGLILQRQFGGDMVQMLEQTSGLLRERLELEREVRAITTQGRLSGLVIAVLVPVSAGFLLSFNPRYIDVLFDNPIGQALVILALVLQLVGWAIISRLVRIKY